MIYDTLNVEEVEELMEVRASFPIPSLMHPNFFHRHMILSSHVGAPQRKLATVTKIREVAQNLARLNASSSSLRVMCQSTSAHETSEHKVDATRTELLRVQEHAANVTLPR